MPEQHDSVEVYNAFLGRWVSGFEVAEVLPGDRYRLRRLSDGALVPDATSRSDLRGH